MRREVRWRSILLHAGRESVHAFGDGAATAAFGGGAPAATAGAIAAVALRIFKATIAGLRQDDLLG